ncbi:PP2C family protein-serine/threonine phosphatase [Cohnella terricola]|uniref:Serine/threonine protein phosphatase n=1 Tax=Cohnella terricola TaxID=1289167 RepID=A0A559J5C2_9BACL|nr:serine/threonine protein phosphatase [Cohnella terricola]TVX95088.1 serine/threonine protein phosphatase [Cohnella terricola]
MRKENSGFKTAFVSEAGTFMENRDYFAYVELEDMACWVIADGLDRDSEVYSAEMAVTSLLEEFTEKPTMSRRKLEEYIRVAHEWLQYESRRVRLKTSLILIATNYTDMVWVSAGNVRLHHFRGGRLLSKSMDQSLTQVMADEGVIADSSVDQHEERHNLLQYLGMPDKFDPYISNRIKLTDGDVLLLSTAGLWEAVSVPEMLDSLEEAQDPAKLVDTLEEVLLSKQRAVVPNYTAAAIYVDKAFKEEKKDKKKLVKWIIVSLIPIIIAVGVLIYFQSKSVARMAETAQEMLEQAENGDRYAAEESYAEALKAYSEARNASVKLKDKVHKIMYTKKYNIAQLIVGADEYAKDGNYAKAAEQYKKAKKEAENVDVFNPKELDLRIDRMENYVQINEWVKEADLRAEAQQYADAIVIYVKARKAAIEATFPAGEQQIRTKLENAESKMADLKKQQKKLIAEQREQKGDRYFDANEYKRAAEAYSNAQEKYQEIDMLDKVLAMERKIGKAEEKLNPIIPAAKEAASSPTGGDGPADQVAP